MTATLVSRDPFFAGRLPVKGTLPVAANVKILKGTLVAIDASSRATVPAAGLKIVGVAIADFDNTGGAAAAFDVELDYGVFGFVMDGTAAKVGEAVYALDNQSVTLTASTNGLAGVVTEVRDGLTFVWVNPALIGILTIAVLGLTEPGA